MTKFTVETDYLFINIDEKLKEHWKNCLKRDVWVSKIGEETPIKELSENHLRTIIQMLIRFNSETSRLMLSRLIKETHNRNLEIKIVFNDIKEDKL